LINKRRLIKTLEKSEIELRLPGIPGWHYSNSKITKEFECDNFANALSLVVRVGIVAEKLDHHPEILMHSWNKVKVITSTHSLNGITELDFKLAGDINRL